METIVPSRCHRYRGAWRPEEGSPLALQQVKDGWWRRKHQKVHWDGFPTCPAAGWNVRMAVRNQFYKTPKLLRCMNCDRALRQAGPYGKSVPI